MQEIALDHRRRGRSSFRRRIGPAQVRRRRTLRRRRRRRRLQRRNSDPLPHWYTVEADTAACLMIRNRFNGSHLIYRKRLRDYIVIPEQSFTHIERDSNLWPNVFTTHVSQNTRRVDKALFERGLQGQGSVAVVVVDVAEGSAVAEPALGRSAAEKKNGRDADDQEQFPA